MSAYVVSKEEISILVAAGLNLSGDARPAGFADQAGQQLLDECVRSVSYRYPNDDLGELPGSYNEETSVPGIEPFSIAEWLTPYAYVAPDSPVTRGIVAETIRSYEYQACEHPEWEASWSHEYCQGLTRALSRLPEPEPEANPYADYPTPVGDRNEAIKAIRAALKRRSGKAWSVTGGKGTAWGWIHISAPPRRLTGAHVQKVGAEFGEYEHVDTGEPQQFGLMTPQDCAELAALLGKDRPVHCQGESVPASSGHRTEYVDRAEGREPRTYGQQSWD